MAASSFHATSATAKSTLASRRDQMANISPLAITLPPAPRQSSSPLASMDVRTSRSTTGATPNTAQRDDSDGYITDIYDPRALASFSSSHCSPGLSYFPTSTSLNNATTSPPLFGSATRTHDELVSGAAAQLSASQRFKFRRHKHISHLPSSKVSKAKNSSASRTFSSALAFWRDRSISTPTPSASECSSSVDASDFTPTPTPPQLNVALGPEALAVVAARALCSTPEAFDEGTLKSAATRDKVALQGLGLCLREGAKERVLDAHYGMEQQWATSSAAHVLVPMDVSTRLGGVDAAAASTEEHDSKPVKLHRSRHSEGSLLALTLNSSCLSTQATSSASMPASPAVRSSNEAEPTVALSLIEAVCLPPQLKPTQAPSASSSTPSQQMTPVSAHTFGRACRVDSVSTTRAPSIVEASTHASAAGTSAVPLSNRVARLRARPATAGDVFSSTTVQAKQFKESALPRPKSAGVTEAKKLNDMPPPTHASLRKSTRICTPTHGTSPGTTGSAASTRSRFRRLASRESGLREGGGAHDFGPSIAASNTFSSLSLDQQKGRISPHPRRVTSWTSKLRAQPSSNAVSIAAWRLASTSATAPSSEAAAESRSTSTRPDSYSFVDSLALGSMTNAPTPAPIPAESMLMTRSKTESSLNSMPSFMSSAGGGPPGAGSAFRSPRSRGRTDSRTRTMQGTGRPRAATMDTMTQSHCSSQLSWSPDPTAPDVLLGAGQAICMQSAILDAARARRESIVPLSANAASPGGAEDGSVASPSHGSRMRELLDGREGVLMRPTPVRRHSEGPEEFLRAQQNRLEKQASSESGTWWLGNAASSDARLASPFRADPSAQDLPKSAHQRAPSMPLSMPAQWRSSVLAHEAKAKATRSPVSPLVPATPSASPAPISTPRSRLFSLKARRPVTAAARTPSTSSNSRFPAISASPAPTRPKHIRSQTAVDLAALPGASTVTAAPAKPQTPNTTLSHTPRPKGAAKRVVSDGLALLRRAKSGRRSASVAP